MTIQHKDENKWPFLRFIDPNWLIVTVQNYKHYSITNTVHIRSYTVYMAKGTLLILLINLNLILKHYYIVTESNAYSSLPNEEATVIETSQQGTKQDRTENTCHEEHNNEQIAGPTS